MKRSKYSRRGASYRYKYTDPVTGRQCSRTGTVAELDAFCEELDRVRRLVRTGRMGRDAVRRELAPLVGNDTCADLWQGYISGVLNPSSRSAGLCAWRHRLEPYFGKRRWWELDAAVMREWQATLRRGYAPKSVKDAFTWLLASYHLALNSRRIDAIPWGAWQPERPQEQDPTAIGSLDEIVSLIVAARSLDEKEWEADRPSYLAAAVQVLMLTGMRQGEACGLGWDRVEIDSDPALLRIDYQATRHWRKHCPGAVRPTLKPKGRTRPEHRVQVMHPSVVLALRHLRDHLQRHNLYHDQGPVFPSLRVRRGDWRDGRLIDPRQMRRIARLAGLSNADDWVTHTTRHSFGTIEAFASGGDLKATQQRIGHSSVRMLERYLHKLGHGLARSSVPELPELTGAAIPAEGVPVTDAPLVEHLSEDGEPFTITTEVELMVPAGAPPDLPLAPLCDLVQASADRLRQAERRRKEKRAELDRASRRPFIELAEEWLRAPDPTRVRPKPVTHAAQKNYARGYNEAMRAGMPVDACRRAGQRAKRACLASWAQALSRVSQRLRDGALALPAPAVPEQLAAGE